VIAVRGRMPALCETLRALCRHAEGSALHPEPRTNVVSLAAADLAYRVARSAGETPRFEATAEVMRSVQGQRPRHAVAAPLMAVLDLRSVAEATLIYGARWLYRSRRLRGRHGEMEPARDGATVVPLHGPER
jgi:hypothetical protein